VHLGVNVNFKWIDTSTIDPANVVRRLNDCHGIIVPGGFGVRGTEGKIECIRYARENKVPYLGLCLGFQMAVIEYARNVCGIKDANSTEFDADCEHAVIDILPEQKRSKAWAGNMRWAAKTSTSRPAHWQRSCSKTPARIRLRFRHRYEVDPRYIPTLEEHGIDFLWPAPASADHADLELPKDIHPFFPGYAKRTPSSRAVRCGPQPFFIGLVKAAMEFASRTRAQVQSI